MRAETTSTKTPTGRSLLVVWANEQDNWVRALVAEIIQTRQELPETRATHFYGMLLREKELAAGDSVSEPALTDAAASGDIEAPLVLTSLKEVENVNALATGQTIECNPRLTLLFGENAAGKTGYVRILKHLASVRTAEAILPNIELPGTRKSPEASVTYQLGGTDQDPFRWRGQKGVYPFTRIDVFDARGTLLHVDQELTYIYTPSDLALFRLTHRAIEQVRSKLEQAQKESQPKGNPYLPKFARDSGLYTKIEALGPSTSLKELETLATVSKEEEDGLQALRDRVDALRSKSTDVRLELATGEQNLYGQVSAAAKLTRAFDVNAYAAALKALETANKNHAQATEEAFAGVSIPGALEGAWKTFIEAGETYLQETQGPEYPEDGDQCAYCRQPLGAAAISLVQKYRDFCNNELRKAVDNCQNTLDSLTAPVRELDLDHLKDELEKKVALIKAPNTPPQVLSTAVELVTVAKTLQEAIEGQELTDTSILSALAKRAGDQADNQRKQAATLVTELTEQAQKRKETLAEERKKLRNLEDRLTLRELLPQITKHVEAAQWADKARTYVGRFRALTKSLTETSKIASGRLLNQDFEKAFLRESKALRAPEVSLDFPGRKGQAARRKSLAADYKLSDVLSEGEQKVIALADFLAEAALRQSPTPVVFDDPVTSLDYKRLQYLVDRFVEISRERQVLVFTHNIWFTMELLSRFEDNRSECTYYNVCEDNGLRGVVARGNHPRLDTFRDKRARINTLIRNAKAQQPGPARDALIEKAYEDLRGACEIVVEADLLQNVTQRYQPNVMMTALPRIKPDGLRAAIEVVMPIFKKACRSIASHSQPLETLSVRPSLEDLEEDWTKLQTARDAYLKG